MNVNLNPLPQKGAEDAKTLPDEIRELAVLRSLQHRMRPPMEAADCVCCGEPGQTGRYEGLPVCFPCYQTGLLREWLDQQPELPA